MPKVFTSKSQNIGELGEEIVCRYLDKNRFQLLERNYTRFFGEIDIICEKNKTIHFIEVKSVSYETKTNVPRETHFRPEENMTKRKFNRIYKTVVDYLINKKVLKEVEWQIDLYCVYIDLNNKNSRVAKFENIVM